MQTRNGTWLISASLAMGLGTYFAAQFYADFEHRPETRWERKRAEARMAEWIASLSEQDQFKLRRFNESVAAVASAGGIDSATAVANMRSAVAALHRKS